MPPPSPRALDKALALLTAITADQGQTPLSSLAGGLGLPPATAHRMVAVFERRGFLVRTGRGRYLAGHGLTALAAPDAERRVIEAAGAPIVAALAKRTGLAAHLGVLENDMVTYLVKAGRGDRALFTRAGIQLEAYCSGIGKALLAHLPEEARERYLAGGPFIRLTEQTLIDPDRLRDELARTKARGYAIDDREISDAIRCVAAPVRAPGGGAVAAISLSSSAPEQRLDARLDDLRTAARALEAALFPHAPAPPR